MSGGASVRGNIFEDVIGRHFPRAPSPSNYVAFRKYYTRDNVWPAFFAMMRGGIAIDLVHLGARGGPRYSNSVGRGEALTLCSCGRLATVSTLPGSSHTASVFTPDHARCHCRLLVP
jgi:hypothetical protein